MLHKIYGSKLYELVYYFDLLLYYQNFLIFRTLPDELYTSELIIKIFTMSLTKLNSVKRKVMSNSPIISMVSNNKVRRDRCINPMNYESHVGKNLRRVSNRIIQMFPLLPFNAVICNSCRNKCSVTKNSNTINDVINRENG